MNLDENIDKNKNNNEEITVNIRTMDKEFEVKIKSTLTIRELKEKIEQVIYIFIQFIILYIINN